MPKLFYFCIYFSTCFLRYYFDIQYHSPNIQSTSCTLLKKRSEPRLNVKVAAKSRNMVVQQFTHSNPAISISKQVAQHKLGFQEKRQWKRPLESLIQGFWTLLTMPPSQKLWRAGTVSVEPLKLSSTDTAISPSDPNSFLTFTLSVSARSALSFKTTFFAPWRYCYFMFVLFQVISGLFQSF